VGLKNLTPLLNWLFPQVNTKWVSKIWHLYWTGYSRKLIPSGSQKSDTFIELVIPASWYQVDLKNLIPLCWTGYSSKLIPSGSFKILIFDIWYFVNLDILIFLIFDIWYLVANNFKHNCAKKV
jgi:hypothetical protein